MDPLPDYSTVFGFPLLSAIGELFRCLFTYVTANFASLLSVISGIVTTAESTGFSPFKWESVYPVRFRY